jgi:hypothetical protein
MLQRCEQRLKDVYWIGGGSGAGKSTIARRVARQHSLYLYATDNVMSDHASRMLPEDAPYLSSFKGMNMDERWLNRRPEIMLETFHWFRGEGFSLIVEDLVRLAADSVVIARASVCCHIWSNRCSPILAMPSGFCRRLSSVWPPWTVVARGGNSYARRPIRSVPGATCSSATGCSRMNCWRERRASNCLWSRSI